MRRGLDRAFVLFGNTRHNHLSTEAPPSGDASWQEFSSNQRGWKLDITLRKSEHGSFSDLQVGLPQIARALGLPPAFFDLHLHRHDNSLLDGPSPGISRDRVRALSLDPPGLASVDPG